MSISSRTRLINPRLGLYFGIFSAALAGLVLLLLIFEQLGTGELLIREAMATGVAVFFVGIALATTTNNCLDYFTAGRRVPPFFNGLVLGVAALGGTGLVVFPGLLFAMGFDALCLIIGWSAGLTAMVLFIAPYVRKSGAYTIPSFLCRRFQSNVLRVLAAALLSVPVLLLIAAELRIGAFLGGWMLGTSEQIVIIALVAMISLMLAAGGMRSLTWSGSAKAIAAFVALLVPVTVLAALATNLPLPQWSHGPVLRALGRQEVWQGFPQVFANMFDFQLVGQEMVSITKRFATPFGDVGVGSFILTGFALMMGIASSPVLLQRAGTTSGVYQTRHSLGWAVVVFGIMIMTMSSIAVFMRDMLMEFVVGADRNNLPGWFSTLMAMGFADLDGNSQKLIAASIKVKRDAVLFALPIAAGFPATIVYLAVIGALSAALLGAASAIFTLGSSISEDVIQGFKWNPVEDHIRLPIARLSVIGAAIVGGVVALQARADPLDLLLWSLAISGATAFPVLILSIWWRRLNKWGAAAAMTTGFTIAVLAILAGEASWLGFDGALAGLFGVPAGFAAGVIVSQITPSPPREVLETLLELRIPGGETVYDRDMRLHRLKQNQKS